MANIQVKDLTSAALPVQSNDILLLSRGGTVVSKILVSDLNNGLFSGINITTPNNVIPVESISASDTLGTTYTNIDVAVVPKGTGSFSLRISDNTAVGGNKRGANAVDLQTSRNAAAQVASGSGSFTAGTNNTASASGAVSIGTGNSATAVNSFCLGNSSQATGISSISFGAFSTTNSIQGQVAFGHNSPTLGQYQTTFTGLRMLSTGATPVRATADGAAASTTNQLVLRNNSVFAVEGSVVAYDITTLDSASFSFSALVKRGANAAATSIVGTPVISRDFGDAATATWAVTLVADTTNGALGVNVTGAGANQIRWMIEMYTQEAGS